jgi:hypothetical protein
MCQQRRIARFWSGGSHNARRRQPSPGEPLSAERVSSLHVESYLQSLFCCRHAGDGPRASSESAAGLGVWHYCCSRNWVMVKHAPPGSGATLSESRRHAIRRDSVRSSIRTPRGVAQSHTNRSDRAWNQVSLETLRTITVLQDSPQGRSLSSLTSARGRDARVADNVWSMAEI